MSDFSVSHRLETMMQQAGIPSFKALERRAGVSQWQIRQLRQGNLGEMRLGILEKIALALNISLSQLIEAFTGTPKGVSWEEEYQHLAQQMAQQKQELLQQFQENAIQILESWLLQWPTAAYSAQQKPDLPATRLLPLVKPVENLLAEWGVEATEHVGAEVAYDEQKHQLMEGEAESGVPVKVRYTGYRQGNKQLYRAKVSPITISPSD